MPIETDSSIVQVEDTECPLTEDDLAEFEASYNPLCVMILASHCMLRLEIFCVPKLVVVMKLDSLTVALCKIHVFIIVTA